MCVLFSFFFFFKQKTAYEMRISDWSSDVCSSDLLADFGNFGFGAEILDLRLQDFRNLCGADVHHATPFMAVLRLLSLLRTEASIMRDPSLTTRPPIRRSEEHTSESSH